MNGRGAALAVASLFLLSLPPAQAGTFASLLASEARIGDASLDGELEGAAWHGTGDAPPVALAGRSRIDLAGLSISAARASVTVHHSERYAAVEGEALEPTTWTLRNVTTGAAHADAQDARVVAVPAPSGSARVGLDAALLEVLPAPEGTQTHSPVVRTVPPVVVDTGDALQVQHGGDGLLRITGAVRLVVTGVDLPFASDSGPGGLHTRRDVEGAEVQVQRSSYAAHSIVHEAVLDLEDAVVLLPASQAFVRSASVAADGAWSLERATGALGPDGEEARDASIALDGDLRATMGRAPSGLLAIALEGTPSEVSVDGRPVALEAPSRTKAGAVLSWILVGIVVASTAHLGSGRSRFRRLDEAMDREEYDRALRLTKGFRGHPILAQDATLAAAICLLALGRPADAGERLARQRRWTLRRRPTRDFLLARADAALGRHDEASRHLARSLMAEPSLLAAAHADRLLDAILRASRPPPPQEAYA